MTKSTNAKNDVTEMLGLSDKVFKIKSLKQNENIESSSKELKDVWKDQRDILVIRNTMTEIKTSLIGFSSEMEMNREEKRENKSENFKMNT